MTTPSPQATKLAEEMVEVIFNSDLQSELDESIHKIALLIDVAIKSNALREAPAMIHSDVLNEFDVALESLRNHPSMKGKL